MVLSAACWVQQTAGLAIFASTSFDVHASSGSEVYSCQKRRYVLNLAEEWSSLTSVLREGARRAAQRPKLNG